VTSPALALYLAFSRRAAGFASRKLERRLEQGKEDAARIGERRGEPGQPRPRGELLWFHAASVGEVLSIQELIRRLGEEDDRLNFLVTTGTVTSARAVANRLPDAAIHQFAPLDVAPWIGRFLDHWKPDIAIWTESELWPAMLTETHARGIPMLLLNARMSARSFRRWRLVLPLAARHLLRLFRAVQAQDELTASRLTALGLPADRLAVTGTLKEGSSALPFDEAERAELAGVIGRRAVWLAASTHPGEEEAVSRAHREVMRRAPRTLLILVPRHPERGAELAETLRAEGWRLAQRSAGEPLKPDTEVYLADTLGELGLWYRLAPISFVGGSLVPVGGHNPFEPAGLGSAIVHGPHVTNFRDIYDRLTEAGASRLVRRPDDLAAAIIELLAPDKVAALAHAAWETCSSGTEVTDRAIELIFNHLGTDP